MCLAAYVRPTGLLVGRRPREKVRGCAVVCLAAYVRPNKKLTPDPPACKKLINDPAWEIRLDK